MPEYLAAKAPTEVVERRWLVPVDADDGADSAALVAAGVTVDSNSFEGNELVLQLSAGAAAATGSVVATITTSQSRTLVETLYIPIVASASQIAETALDYCSFALRKVPGLGNTLDAGELKHALECLNALVAEWRKGGADIGAAFPIVSSTVIYSPDWAVSALRYNLMLEGAQVFNLPMTPVEVSKAQRGLQLVKHNNLPAMRAGVEYF